MAGKAPGRTVVNRAGFAALLADVKGRIQNAQTRALLAVNSELVRLYWDIGRIIDDRQRREGWGAAVIPRLAVKLKNELPELKGFSERNIKLMLAFYREYSNPGEFVHQAVSQLPGAVNSPQPVAKNPRVKKVQPPVAQLPAATFWSVPWAHHVIIVQKVKDLATRRWYMEQTLAHGWSRNMLALQIDHHAHARHGKAVSNFASALPAGPAGQVAVGSADRRGDRGGADWSAEPSGTKAGKAMKRLTATPAVGDPQVTLSPNG